MRFFLVAVLSCLALPAVADVQAVLQDHVQPRIDRFALKTGELAEAAGTDCTATALRPAYQDAFDAWMGVSHLSFGPLEDEGRMLAIAFWPDSRGMVARALSSLVADQDQIVQTPEGFAEVSVAARGLFALERLLYDDDLSGYGTQDYECKLVRAIARDLARMAAAVDRDWDEFAKTMLTAGQGGNSRFLTEREPRLALYTALMTGLEFTEDQRLGRPLGTFERPRPNRAEARRSGRSLRNAVLSLEALRDLARSLSATPIPRTEAAFDEALETASRIETSDLASVADPSTRIRVEALQQRIGDIRESVAAEIGAALGLSAGFNSMDGD